MTDADHNMTISEFRPWSYLFWDRFRPAVSLWTYRVGEICGKYIFGDGGVVELFGFCLAV